MTKSKSKRSTLKQKYKVQRKCKDHKSKMKKLAKEHPELLRRGKKQDPGVPNLWPFKEAMLRDAENEKIAEMEAKDREKQVARAVKEHKKMVEDQQARELANQYKAINTPEGQRKWYFRELMKVIDTSDIILQVLDARDPQGCRALDIERKIASMQNKEGYSNKKLVLVLNKIDMVPSEVVQDWVKHLRREHPTIAFKSSTQKHRGFLNTLDIKASKASQKALDTKSAVGSQALIQLLKNYCRSSDLKKGLTVGVIGYPNVGKSSVINSLKMSRAVQVSAAAGCTKSLQQVKLDSNITLVDSPGVLFAADDENSKGEEAQRNLLLRNVLRVDQVEDPINAIQGILERCTKEQLMNIYQIAEFKDAAEFLLFVAHRRGKIGKGGIPNMHDAARCILQDWNEGKIPFYTLPPENTDIRESTVVSSWGDAFDIHALLDSANDNTVKVLRENKMGINAMDDEMGDYEDDDEDMDEDDMDDDTLDAYSNFKPAAIMSADPVNSGFVIESDDDEEEEAAPVYRRNVVPAKSALDARAQKPGKAKASVVMSKDYLGGVAPVKTKAELKKLAKKEKRASAQSSMGDDDEYDFIDY